MNYIHERVHNGTHTEQLQVVSSFQPGHGKMLQVERHPQEGGRYDSTGGEASGLCQGVRDRKIVYAVDQDDDGL